MMRASMGLSLLGLSLLVLSLVPWPAAARQASPPIVLAVAQPTAPALPASGAMSDADYGRLLFTVKGCITCHQHGGVTGSASDGFYTDGPPNLTAYQPDPEFVRRWLINPQGVRASAQMPDLDLTEAEIDALIAFLRVEE